MPFRDRHSGGAPPRSRKREGRLRPLDGGGRLLVLPHQDAEVPRNEGRAAHDLGGALCQGVRVRDCKVL